jgi:hypothetical protein
LQTAECGVFAAHQNRGARCPRFFQFEREWWVTVQEAIATAEQILPGRAAPEGTEDSRWQAVIEIGNFVAQEPETIWPFVLKWGSHEDEDLRTAIATCLLEHLLEHHFDLLFPRVETAARSNAWFADTTGMCGKFGEAEEPARAARFDRLRSEIRKGTT